MISLLNHRFHPGKAGQPALLLVHPLGADLAFWEECIAAWWPGFSCLTCDLRNAGASPRASGSISIAEHVADLESLRQSLGLQAVVPVGCAIGSMVAAAYAASHPDRTLALVLSNPALQTGPEARDMLAARARRVRQSGMAAILPDAVDKAFLEQPRDERYSRYLARFGAQDAEAYALSVEGILDADIAHELSLICCAALVVAGRHDVLLPPAQAHAVCDLMAEARFVQIDEAAHFTPFQRPREFSDLVSDFLNRLHY